ncbi:LLM class flavin-dependent oxidoreductase [Marinobacter sp. AL4B]|uniref:LLM class flavin-dependent oxidoreductase n=1 Tax=Marinobacter sp. AL4B TaxID=2871173 RepID=UPI001CAA7A70|nr:LLM class flavin-dependent oxidoreductase [Marinobacter sp. AL4B]MBZ0333016.1 LLM class flavin-dependent oxidoreductase [Marinobacter sp. AL4B]
MKFGIFLPNGSNGYIPSKDSPVYQPTFQHNLEITLEAEKQGLDFVLSMMKYKGFGGDTGYWDSCLETFTLMAGLAAKTDKIGLFPTVTLLAHNPAITARMVATIDQISNGRCGLNIVTGWNKPEYTQMGLWKGDEYYHKRYEFAEEYLGLVKSFWNEEYVSYSSDFFHFEDCACWPKPSRQIPIVCAGQSPAGIDFTARNGDHSFIMAEKNLLAKTCESMRRAAEKNNRQVGIFALFQLIIANSDDEAIDICNSIVDGADRGAINNILASASMDTSAGGTSERMRQGLGKDFEEGNLAFMGMPVIHGSPKTIARKIDEISETAGLDGILFSMPDFVSSIKRFGEEVKPLLKG